MTDFENPRLWILKIRNNADPGNTTTNGIMANPNTVTTKFVIPDSLTKAAIGSKVVVIIEKIINLRMGQSFTKLNF